MLATIYTRMKMCWEPRVANNLDQDQDEVIANVHHWKLVSTDYDLYKHFVVVVWQG